MKSADCIFQGAKSNRPSRNYSSILNDYVLQKVNDNLMFFIDSTRSSVEDFDFLDITKKNTILLAVSGGVDSQVMLHSVYTLAQHFSFSVHVVTVNHNIRSCDESQQDAELVFNYCKNVLNVPCKIITIEPMHIEMLSKQRNRGIEEAARHIRYTSIRNYAASIQAPVVFFAHNRDDHLETLVQHFLQGASAGISGFASSGIRQLAPFPELGSKSISKKNLILFRPLLTVSRKDIERYAQYNEVPFREDSTNTDITYYRNRVRHKLIPVLNEYFSGWDTGVMNGAQKAFEVSNFVENNITQDFKLVHDSVRLKSSDFFSQGFPIRIRLLYRAIDTLGIEGRMSYELLKAFANGQPRVEGLGLEFFNKNDEVVIRHKKPVHENFDIFIEKEGSYTTNEGVFEVKASVEKQQTYADTESGDYYIGTFCLPLRIRSRLSGDTIRTAQGTHKSIKKIFSEWRVDMRHKNTIPMIESGGELQCVWGAPYGYKNWYVIQSDVEQHVYIRFIRNDK